MAWFVSVMVLVAAAVVGIAIWDMRRKAAAREAASMRRLEEMFLGRAAAGSGPATAAAPAPVAAVPPAANAAVGATAISARERFLGQRETLLYYLLRTGLTDHEIFANVALASVIEAPPGASEREQHLRRLAPYLLDYVVCDKSMRVVAVIDIDSASAGAAAAQQVKAELLKQAGIRLVRINPAAAPRREQLRGLVLGG